MSITIGYDFRTGKIIETKSINDPFQYEINNDELNILMSLTELLGGKNFKIVKPAEDYTTLQYKDRDLCRLKYTPKTHWIRVFVPPANKNKYIENILFEYQKNKNQLFWVSYFDNSLAEYIPALKDAMNFIDNSK